LGAGGARARKCRIGAKSLARQALGETPDQSWRRRDAGGTPSRLAGGREAERTMKLLPPVPFHRCKIKDLCRAQCPGMGEILMVEYLSLRVHLILPKRQCGTMEGISAKFM